MAAADKPGSSGKQYCKIHHTKGHDLQNCRQVELLAEKQKAEYERRDKEKGQDGTKGSGDPGSAKKAKADDPGKEIAGCAACRALAAADKPRGSDKQYCKIHRTKGHDLQSCKRSEEHTSELQSRE